jgi:hypothetical protein
MLAAHLRTQTHITQVEKLICLQKDMHNDVPDAVLQKCADADKILVENLLRLAQTELLVLNLASVSLSSMRALQAYSPARVGEVRTIMQEGSMLLVLDVCGSSVRMGTTELEIMRITKRHRVF